MLSNQEAAQAVYTMIVYGFTFVFSAGVYGSLYAAGVITGKTWLVRLSYVFAALLIWGVVGMLTSGYLDRFWSLLMLFAGSVYLFLPQITMWAVREFHRRHVAVERG